MAQHPDGAQHLPPDAAGRVERLGVPWWLWLVTVGSVGVLAAELHLGASGAQSWLPYLLLLPLTVAGLAYLGRIRVGIEGDDLRIDDARIPLRWVAGVTPLDPPAKREVLGPLAHPYAFVVQRPWISSALLVRLDDPADPTPYCVLSTRHPDELAAAVAAAAPRQVARQDFADLDVHTLG